MKILSRKVLLPSVLCFLILILLAVGCTTVEGIGDYNRGRLSGDGESSDSGVFQTATPPTSPDLRGEVFPVVLFVPTSSGYAQSVESIHAGVLDGVKYINDRGGVNGAEINLLVVDLPDNPEEILKLVTNTLDKTDPLLVLMAAQVDELLYYEINHQAVPFLYYGIGGARFDPPTNQTEMLFWLTPTSDEQLSFFVRSLWANWETIRPAGAYNELKVGFLEDANGLPDKFIDEEIIRLGGDNFAVPVRWAVPSSPNASVTNFLIDAVQNGVTVIYSDTPSTGTAVLLNDIGSLALEDTFLVGGSIWSMDAGISQHLLTGRNEKGYMVPFSTAWWTEEANPAIQIAANIHNGAGRPESMRDAGYLIGLGSIELVRTVFQASVSQLKSGDFSSEDVYQQLNRLEEYELMGGLFTVDYSNGRRSPTQMRLWQFEGNHGWKPVSEWGEVP